MRIFKILIIFILATLYGCSPYAEFPSCDEDWLHDKSKQAIIDTYMMFGVSPANETVRHLTDSIKNMEALSPEMDEIVRREQVMKYNMVREGFTMDDVAVCRAEYIKDTAYMLITVLRNPDDPTDLGVIVQNIGTPPGSPGMYGWVKNQR